jgi:hypothetical protein
MAGHAKKQNSQPQTAPSQPRARFIGHWKLVNNKGIVSSYLTVAESGAKRHHAPNSPGTWEVVGNEARFTWDDGFWDILRLEADGRITFLSLGEKAKRWDARPKFRLEANRIEPPPPLPDYTKAEKCRRLLLNWWMRQKQLPKLPRPALHRRVGELLKKVYDTNDEALCMAQMAGDEPLYLELWEEVESGAIKRRTRASVNIMRELRKAIQTCGRNAKSATIIANAQVERQAGLKSLRELQEMGEYSGFNRRPRRS